jgi:hypothetical protein
LRWIRVQMYSVFFILQVESKNFTRFF